MLILLLKILMYAEKIRNKSEWYFNENRNYIEMDMINVNWLSFSGIESIRLRQIRKRLCHSNVVGVGVFITGFLWMILERKTWRGLQNKWHQLIICNTYMQSKIKDIYLRSVWKDKVFFLMWILIFPNYCGVINILGTF